MEEFVEPSTDTTAAAIKGEHKGGGRGVWGVCTTNHGVHGDSISGRGVQGISETFFGVSGVSTEGTGVGGESAKGVGVLGISPHNFGVQGISESNHGVHGDSKDGRGVQGISETFFGVSGVSRDGIGVGGESTTNIGVFGKCSGSNPGVQGVSDTGHGVHGESRTNHAIHGESSAGRGVVGKSQTFVGVTGESNSSDGVQGLSATGIGVHGKGRPAGFFEGDVVVTGDIQLTDAGDFAEEFDLAEHAAAAEPGTVMVLNDAGELAASTCAYDKRVAGVVSGAGAYKPGIVLDRRDTGAVRQPIGLLGKVFCKVDAQFGAIAVGDLLTTSATPGHAMTTNDPIRSFGAVIGKALRPLAEGRGLIPILIALQ